MSMCFNLVCPETKKAIWCGQNKGIYSGKEALELLADWLHAHRNKAIFFVNDESSKLLDVEDKDFIGLEGE